MAEKSVPKLLSRYDELEKRQRIYKSKLAGLEGRGNLVGGPSTEWKQLAAASLCT